MAKEREREKTDFEDEKFLFKAKIDDLLRREKEREQRVNHNRVQKADSAMSMSTDVVATRRAISASRLRSNQPGMIYFLDETISFFLTMVIIVIDSAHHRRGLNESLEENSHRKFPSLSSFALSNKKPLPIIFFRIRDVCVDLVEKKCHSLHL